MPVDLAMVGRKLQPIEFTYEERDVMLYALGEALEVRFSGVVFPGETIIAELWKNGPGALIVQAKTRERGEVVISAASATIA
jgi:hypothetical protein